MQNNELPSILSEASSPVESRERCLAAGMDDYVNKPIRPAELQAAMERWQIAAQHPSASAAL